jgi:hypothetical protein
MTTTTLMDDYRQLSSTNRLYQRSYDRLKFLLNSFVGGEDYRLGGYLTRYALETDGEYQARLAATPLVNYCASTIQTYISFMFREHPDRDFDTWTGQGDVEDFLRDANQDGQSFDNFMKQASIWSSVFGSAWIMVTKPNVGQVTVADEQAMGIRPYVNLLTPLSVSDWRWERQPNGRYELSYFKYIEEVIDSLSVVKVWTRDTIETWILDDQAKEATMQSVEPNGLGMIPAVMVYNQRGISRDVGVSDINDIADIQRQIYNLNSENEQSIRLAGHPTLVVPSTAQIGSGAGAMIQLQEGTDGALNPYMLNVDSGSISGIHASIDKLTEAIEKISFTSGVSTTKTQSQSGVALETEFALLNSKLAEKADQMELAEESVWKLFGMYQGREWTGEVKYPDSFNLRDTAREIGELVSAKSAATDPRVLEIIDQKLLSALGEDASMIREEVDPALLPERPAFDPHIMIDPVTGTEYIARTEAEHLAYAAQGYYHKED